MKRNFSYLLTVILILSTKFSARSQTTWIKTLNIDIPSLETDSETVGPQEMFTRPDRKIWMLYQANQDHDTKLCLIDSGGNLLLDRDVASYATLHSEDCYSLHPTTDNGCVYFMRHYTWGVQATDYAYRLNSSGGVIWTKTYVSQLFTISSISPTFYNTVLIIYQGDSLAEFDGSGNYIRSRVPFSYAKKIISLPDSTFISYDLSTIVREDFTGNQNWTINASGFSVESANLSFIYARSNSAVMKINTTTGNVIWTKPIAQRTLSLTSDDGFISTDTSRLSKYDSTGTLQWSKIISFPYFGLRGAIELSSISYLTGGCWRSVDLNYSSGNGFSPVIIKLDSIGNGVIDSTDYFYNGNANDNYNLGFGDDAVYVAAAMGNAGPKRDSLCRYRFMGKNTYATTWPDGFATGLNYKYSDIDGNGIIDTADISMLSGISLPLDSPYNHGLTPHWRTVSPQSNSPTLIFVFENDSINYSDTIKINVILGSQGLAVDSIYGLSFDLQLSTISAWSQPGIYSSIEIKPSSLGDTSINLYSFIKNNVTGIPLLTSMVLCRTDHINAYVAGDTILSLRYLLPMNTYFINPIRMGVRCKAITKGGFPVDLNIITDSIQFLGTTGINNFFQSEFKLFPNPANDQLLFSFDSENINELNIFDASGRKIFSVNNPGKKYILNVKNFAEGLYYVSSLSSNIISRSKFLVVH